MVEEIEEVHAELKLVLLLDAPVLGQLGIHVGVGRAEAGAARRQVARESADRVANQREVLIVLNCGPFSSHIAADVGGQRPLVVAIAGPS